MEKLGLKEEWKGLLDDFQSGRNALHSQFQELQEHFDSEQSLIRARKRELEGREKELEAKFLNFNSLSDREKELEAKVLNFNSEMKSKAEELNGIERLVEKKRKLVDVSELRLREVEELVREKERNCNDIGKRFEEGSEKLSLVRKEVEIKEARLVEVENSVREKKRDCNFILQCIQERKEKLKKYNEDVELKRRQLEGIRGSIDEGIELFDSTDERIKKAKILLEECNKEVRLESEKLSVIQKSIVECSNTLESKVRIIREMDLKAVEFGLRAKSIEVQSCKLESKERELEGRITMLESREKQVESKDEELKVKEKQFESLGKSFQERQQYLDSQEKMLQECSGELEMKERKLEEQARELEVKQKELEFNEKEIDSTQKSMEGQIRNLKSKQKAHTNQQLVCIPASISSVPSSPVNLVSPPVEIGAPESSLVRNAAALSSPNLLSSQNENVSGNQSMQNPISDPLQASRDPEKMVLKMMQVSFVDHWDKGFVGFDEDVMESNIALLRDLSRVKPHVGSHVKEDAIRLAVQWQEKLRADTENSLEIMCFLHFIAAYGLFSSLNGNEIIMLLGMICQHTQAQELCLTHGFAAKIPAFVQNLIERNQVTEVIGFICTFKLIVKLHPVLILKQHVDNTTKSYLTILREKNSPDEKDDVVDNQIAVLRAVIQCIKDNELESEFSSNVIENEIGMLEKLKENWRSSVPSVESNVELSVPSNVEREQEKGKKRSGSSSSSKTQPLQLRKSKRLRELAERPS